MGWSFLFFLLLFHKVDPKSEIEKVKLTDSTRLLFLVMSSGTMLVTTIYSLSHIAVGYALSLFQLSSLGRILLGYHFFNERSIRKKLLGSCKYPEIAANLEIEKREIYVPVWLSHASLLWFK